VIKIIKAQARRLAGIDIKDDLLIDPVELDKALATKDVSSRLALKAMMAKLRLIP
jgi:hypothetical protein